MDIDRIIDFVCGFAAGGLITFVFMMVVIEGYIRGVLDRGD